MDSIVLPYRSGEQLVLKAPKALGVSVQDPKEGGQRARKHLFEEALGTGFADFLRSAGRVLIIINDSTRPTPTKEMMSALMPYFEEAGIDDENLTILIATGAHRPALESEFEQLLGRTLARRLNNRIVSHVATDRSRLTYLGTTSRGTPVALNSLLFEVDRVVVTGSVEPHYFAGYTGGRKAIMPGIAGYETIEANHRLALVSAARTLALEGNPVHEDFLEVVEFVKQPIFSLMSVLDKDHRPIHLAGGTLTESFLECIPVAEETFGTPIASPMDIVITVANHPMDINLYQAQKALDNGALAVRDGGSLLLVASCREGVGGAAFADLLASSESPDQALAAIHEHYKLGYHKAAKIALEAKRINLYAYTDLDDERVSSLFLKPVRDLQRWFDRVVEEFQTAHRRDPRVLVLRDGGMCVPVLSSSGNH